MICLQYARNHQHLPDRANPPLLKNVAIPRESPLVMTDASFAIQILHTSCQRSFEWRLIRKKEKAWNKVPVVDNCPKKGVCLNVFLRIPKN